MKKLSKIALNQLQGTELKRPELKHIVGGYDGDLPEVTITCGQYSGQCWKCYPKPGACYFSGSMSDYCDC